MKRVTEAGTLFFGQNVSNGLSEFARVDEWSVASFSSDRTGSILWPTVSRVSEPVARSVFSGLACALEMYDSLRFVSIERSLARFFEFIGDCFLVSGGFDGWLNDGSRWNIAEGRTVRVDICQLRIVHFALASTGLRLWNPNVYLQLLKVGDVLEDLYCVVDAREFDGGLHLLQFVAHLRAGSDLHF